MVSRNKSGSGRVNQILLITISGEDQAGVTAGLAALLSEHAANILDIGQAVIHATLSLGLLVELPESCVCAQVEDAVRSFAMQRDLRVVTSVVSSESYSDWVASQGRARSIITLLARKITADQLARVTAVVAQHGLNIDGINRLSGRIPMGELPALSKACVEFSARGSLRDPASFRRI